jgi:UDP-N-acetylmuramyl tripeptide synthase
MLSNDECLVILGKGHEETQEEKNKTIFFSDHEVINEIYK